MNFKSWLLHIGKSERTASSYAGAVSKSMSRWAKKAGLTSKPLDHIQSSTEFQFISEGLKQTDIYQQRNTKGKNMYGSALKAFSLYLEEFLDEATQNDIDQILKDKSSTETEKSTLINARVGQGKYRKALIDLWGSCSVTGFTDTRFLVASHIKPWRSSSNQEKLDSYNGLLLLPNLDKAFDLGFISFRDEGEIIISSHLEERNILGVKESMRISLKGGHNGYMEYHRDEVFESQCI